MESFEAALQHAQLCADALQGIRRGMEKEALRINPKGLLAQSSHPQILGSALTHPSITTDFSEALLEFITPPHHSIDAMFNDMTDLHRFACQSLQKQDELLWVSSMPCVIESDDKIPIAEYGSSNPAKMKHLYRVGLSYRYGRSMQAISGIHYNLSFPDAFWCGLQTAEQNTDSLQDYKTTKYLGVIRNFRRYFWLMLYLFGAAPAICPSFVKHRKHCLESLNEKSLYHPYATSLRMGDLGYQSKAQETLYVDYNSLEGYIQSLLEGLLTPHPAYEEIGFKENGEYKQLNTHLLQIENEFYSVIRPKQLVHEKEAPLIALKNRGIEYIEVRSVDVNLYEPLGIDPLQAHFIEAFLLFCLLEPSPPSNPEEYQHILHNQHEVVNRGRDPAVQVYCHGDMVPLRQCAEHWLGHIEQCAQLLTGSLKDARYLNSVKAQYAKLANPDLTPSGKMLKQMQEQNLSFYQLALQQSRQFCQEFSDQALSETQLKHYQTLAAQSLAEQQQIESADNISFQQYLVDYFEQYEQLK